jgi:ATPase family associated with various cellular activities (AAA)
MTDQLFGGALLVGLLAAFWGKVKLLLSKLASLMIVSAHVRDETMFAVRLYLRQNFKASRFGTRSFFSMNLFIRPHHEYGVVGVEDLGQDPIIFWQGFRFLTLAFVPGDNNKNGTFASARLSFLRGTFDLDAFLFAALENLNRIRRDGSVNVKRFEIVKKCGRGAVRFRGKNDDNPATISEGKPASAAENIFVGWKPGDIGSPMTRGDLWEVLAFPRHVKDCIVEMERWLKSKAWYLDKQISWRRGWLLTGKPGTGKTSLIRAMGQKLDMPIISFDLSTYANDEFSRDWHNLYSHAPCIAVIEDIDGVFEKRRNILGEESGGLTFDCLLNCMSGVEVADGVFTVITTNRPETLDEALGQIADGDRCSRPGRIDRIIELPPLDDDCRRQVARRILSDVPDLIEETVLAGQGDTGAQFQERCCKLALERFWGGKEAARNGTAAHEPNRARTRTYYDSAVR